MGQSSKKGLRFPASLIKPFFEITECSSLAQAFLPYRLVIVLALGEWCFRSRQTLDRIHSDLLSLTAERGRKGSKAKRTREA